jgi:hypothetical protein
MGLHAIHQSRIDGVICDVEESNFLSGFAQGMRNLGTITALKVDNRY